MELKSALKTFFSFKIECNDRGNPVAVFGNLSPFKINIAVKYKIKRKKSYCRLLRAMAKKINQ